MRRYANGIASSLIADRGDIDRRGAMAANDILAVLPVTFRPADAACVQRRAPAVGLLDDHETQRLTASIDGKKMHVSVLNFADWDTHDICDGFDRTSRRRRGVRPRINEIGGEH